MSDTEKRTLSTFDRIMQDSERKEKFEEGYNEFLVGEFLSEAMQENHISVRKLAERAGVSPSIIQNIKSGKSSNITLKKLSGLTSALGYRINFQKVR